LGKNHAQSLQTFPLDSLNPNSLKIKAVWISDDLFSFKYQNSCHEKQKCNYKKTYHKNAKLFKQHFEISHSMLSMNVNYRIHK